MPRNLQRAIRQAIDLMVLVLAWTLAFEVRFEGAIPGDQLRRMWILLPYVVALKLVVLSLLAVGRHSWRYFALRQAGLVAQAVAASTMVLVAARLIGGATTIWGAQTLLVPFGVIAIDASLSLLGLLGVRALRRLQTENAEARSVDDGGPAKRVVLIGAGRAGAMVAKELQARRDVGMVPIGFLDDDANKRGDLIMDLPVLGGPEHLGALLADDLVDDVVITIASATGAQIRRLTEICDQYGLTPKIVPGVYEIVGGNVDVSRLRPVQIEDLLGRETVDLDVSGIREVVQGRTVAVTGAGGSIGSELCRQVARFGPSKIVLIEQAEPALWASHRDLVSRADGPELIPAIADVCDADRINSLFEEHGPCVVFHAAAHKHVPMMEWNPGEAVKNNVLGTKVVADAALAADVGRFVMISTDKAVNPTSVMGATKRIAERYVQHLAATTGKVFVSVRFGNVLGSTGSVVPIFKDQIAKGGPVTVTHPEMVRYFMTIPESAQLVIQAAALGKGGEIFVLDMGEPVKIVDLARDLIRLSGLEPDADIKIEYAGLRPGEKMYEELSLSAENATKTLHPKIWVGKGEAPRWDDVAADLADLVETVGHATRSEAREAVASRVPEFRRDPGEAPAPTPVSR